MKVGDLVRHWRQRIDIGIIIDTRDVNEVNHKVMWTCGDCGWYGYDKLEAICK